MTINDTIGQTAAGKAESVVVYRDESGLPIVLGFVAGCVVGLFLMRLFFRLVR